MNNKNVRLLGRGEVVGNSRCFNWPNAGFEFEFSGEKAEKLCAVINDDDEKCDIIAAFLIENETDKLFAIEAIGRSLATTAKTFETTNNSESQKLKSCIIYVKGDTLVAVVSSNIEKIKTMLADKGFVSAV